MALEMKTKRFKTVKHLGKHPFKMYPAYKLNLMVYRAMLFFFGGGGGGRGPNLLGLLHGEE